MPGTAELVTQEQFLEASLYLAKARDAFKQCKHFALSWDPSNYDTETLVSMLYSWQNDTACYCPNQNLTPVLSEEVDEEIRKLSAMHKITRIEGFNELRAVSHSLKWFSKPLEEFKIPSTILWKPMTGNQKRIWINGRPWIEDTVEGWKKQQYPDGTRIQDLNLLVSISDQGGINRASLDFACYRLGLGLLMLWDASHRTWNDIKWCMKNTSSTAASATSSLFKVFLSFALLFNINYGPAGAKTWFEKRRARLHEFMQLRSANSEPFLHFLPYIQAERQEPEPHDAAGREAVFQSLSRLNSFQALGPLTKLARWFSWFQCEHWWDGEVWCNKMVMMDSMVLPEQDSEVAFCPEVNEVHIPSGLTDKEELAQLKKQHGSFKLAPMLITPSSFWQKQVIALGCKPIWTHHAKRVSEVLKPQDVRDLYIDSSLGMWSQELVDTMVSCFKEHTTFRKLFPDGAVPHPNASDNEKDVLEKRLEVYFRFIVNLLSKRGSSLASQFLRPPFRYSCLLSDAHRGATQRVIDQEWKQILQVESEFAKGTNIKALEAIHCLKSSWVRIMFLSNEADILAGTQDCSDLMVASVQHMGDTTCIENTHQGAKDCLRESRHNVRSRVHKMAAVINTSVMKSRKFTHIFLTEAEKAQASVKQFGRFAPCTHPNSHQMSKQFQSIMQHKGRDHYWPATSASSLFSEVTSLQWLLKGQEFLQRTGYNQATLTALVGKPGSVVASSQESQVYLVLSIGYCGFLACILEVVPSTTTDGVFPAFLCVCKRSAIKIVHIDSLENWVECTSEASDGQ